MPFNNAEEISGDQSLKDYEAAIVIRNLRRHTCAMSTSLFYSQGPNPFFPLPPVGFPLGEIFNSSLFFQWERIPQNFRPEIGSSAK
jgi:hypothetical protein